MNKPILIILGIVLLLVVSGCTTLTSQYNTKSDSYSRDDSSLTDALFGTQCGNGRCEQGESLNNCCQDCGCDTGFYCISGLCQSQCGDSVKASDETSENCCQDAGCPTGEVCQNNKCVELKPEISATFTQTTESFSVTYLKAKGDKVGQITLKNNGNDIANDVKLVLSSQNGYFSDKTINFGTLYLNTTKTQSVDLTFLEKVLDVTTDEDITLNVIITFYNSANKLYETRDSFSMKIKGRNYIIWDKPKMLSSWVTPTQVSIREFAAKSTAGLPAGMSSSSPYIQKMAARWLFESMRAYGIRYVNDAHSSGDYLQFPYETLKNKAGDCDDLAILYASLLESIGLESFLMLVPGHIFAGYIDSKGRAVPIETTSDNFENALYSGLYEYTHYIQEDNYELIYPTKSWYEYPQVNLPEKTELKMPSITKEIGDCEIGFNFPDLFVASVNVKFVNTGDATGAGCAVVATYQNGEIKDSVNGCWIINPGETKDITFQPDIDILSSYSCVSF